MVNARPNIWQLQSQRDVQGLANALDYPDPDIRKRAVMALRSLDMPAVIPVLRAALRHETDAQVRSMVSAALHVMDHRLDVAELKDAGDIPGLIQILNSRQPENVIVAARALGELGDRTAVEPLVILFHNSSVPPAVRLAAAEALLELQSAPAVVTLLGALRRETWQVRRNAAAVLGQIRATWAVEPLVVALDDSHPVVRRTAAAALRRIGTADAIAALRAYLSGKSTAVRPSPAAPESRLLAPAPKSDPAPAVDNSQPAAPDPQPVPRAVPQSAPQAARFEQMQTYKPVLSDESGETSDVQAESPQEESKSRAAFLTRPVNRLIAFLKPSSNDE